MKSYKIVLLALVLMLSVGCAKQSSVKSGEVDGVHTEVESSKSDSDKQYRVEVICTAALSQEFIDEVMNSFLEGHYLDVEKDLDLIFVCYQFELSESSFVLSQTYYYRRLAKTAAFRGVVATRLKNIELAKVYYKIAHEYDYNGGKYLKMMNSLSQ